MNFNSYNAMMQQISWSDMVQYTGIKTQEDVENLAKRGYMVELTADAFSTRA